MGPESKTCQSCKQDFIIEPEDFAFYERIKVPPPTFCPDCRFQRRMMFRNERTMYHSVCGLCGKKILSAYAPEKSYKIYCHECWWSDAWDSLAYGRDYDFKKPFFAQFQELYDSVPRLALEAYQNQNCPYTNFTWYSKDAYFSPSTLYSENVVNSNGTWYSRDIIDSINLQNCQWCYESVHAVNCSESIYLLASKDCLSCKFLYDSRNCSNCFMSGNLRGKSYVWRGEQLTKEDYEKRLAELDFSSYRAMQSLVGEYEALCKSLVHRPAEYVNAQDSVGNYIVNSKECFYCFNVKDRQNMRYTGQADKCRDSCDLYGAGDKASFLYEGVNIGFMGDEHIYFSTNSFSGERNIQYCDNVRNSCTDVFGCVGLRGKQYCILNKQYTKEEYEDLKSKIIGQMKDVLYTDKMGRMYGYGEFFPGELSPFSYNETIAQEYFPLTKPEAVKSGFSWREPDGKDYHPTMRASDFPDRTQDVKDSILDEVIACAHLELGHDAMCEGICATAFKLTKQELDMLRYLNLPLPRTCYNCRHYERLKRRNPYQLWHRACVCDKSNHGHDGKCSNEFETSYAPARPEIVYCETCYNSEIV